MAAHKFEWRCVQTQGLYVIICKCGPLEITQMIERHNWHHSIDRCLLLRRTVRRLDSTMQAVVAVDE